MTKRLLLSPPDVGALEEEYVLRALRSGWVAPTGPEVNAFEKEVADRCAVSNAVAMSSGTAALHLAMLGLGVARGDVVIVATMTFVASANAVVYTGARPCFVDVGADGNLDADLLDEAIADQTRRGNRVAAVMSVDLLGRCADYEALMGVCARHGVPLIEDAAEALGASFQGRPAGAFGAVAALSFNGNKIMTTSGGGMLLTNDTGLADHARFLSTQAREPMAHYEHAHIGYNYRMSNILAALGRAQLARLDSMIARRRATRAAYADAVEAVPGVSVFQRDGDADDNCWLTALIVDPEVAATSTRELLAALEARDFEARPLWKPMHLQPVFAEMDSYSNGRAEALFERGVTLPSGSVHDAAAIHRVTTALREILETS
ncbi:DegT/DnrJ/EryC1/StrS aminotransferase family protein [Nocardioides sp.]|uniref:DegT/DnrJ/EryC1/StrS family aminotransferase n=1 Tax=Nocardioides sp. TaxID=35761 RepID=UPI0027325FF1|nr:aminotransferase class I/II-fold pyridoxal phosphate-dependent enzyme [Nocardioides sp.]MDP3893069.1 aminotransferase class V-fold PLP-dependent enzyme [Nocardioides sp.]